VAVEDLPGVVSAYCVDYDVPAVVACAWHGQFLSRGRTCEAIGELFGVPVSPGAVAGMVKRTAARLGGTLEAIRAALAAASVAHADETGFRVAGKLAWVHSASSGKYVLITVHPKRCARRWTPPG
jgi:transposase